MSNLYHVQLAYGGLFSGETASLWNLEENELQERIIEPRSAGKAVWVDGKKFDWNNVRLSIYEGPSTHEIEDFTPLLGPGAYEINGILKKATDSFVAGDPGGAPGSSPSGSVDVGSSHGEGSGGRTRIFVVHGRQEARKLEVQRTLEKIVSGEVEIVVLSELEHVGMTIMEKFERTATESTYAVVILTADDEGRLAGADQLEGRARQNVIFELGYFYGKLGRPRVAVLKESGVSIHSDMAGVGYIELDEYRGWVIALAKELKSAGIQADINRL